MPGALALRLFYAVKPFVPRRIQVAARRTRARRIWQQLHQNPLPPVPSQPLGYTWPNGKSACAIITHDVELDVGQRNVPALLEIEDAAGIRSCWNFVVRRYTVDRGLVARLREAGHEVGVHGVYHDGKLFDSEDQFLDRLRIISPSSPVMVYCSTTERYWNGSRSHGTRRCRPGIRFSQSRAIA